MTLDLQENVLLAPMTTLGIGGPARFFVRVDREETAVQAYEFAKHRKLPFFVLGGGSNLVVADAGFPGVVAHIELSGREELAPNPHTGERIFRVGAGVDWDSFVAFCVAENLGGVECLSGIPGSVGGTPAQNVGAYGQEVSSVIQSVRVYDCAEERMRTLSPSDCGFSYRRSIFNTTERHRFIVLSVEYSLRSDGAPDLRYAELERYFARQGKVPTLKTVREAVLEIRKSKAMVLSADDPDTRSAGSFFKNPVIDLESFARIASAFPGEEIPHYPVKASGEDAASSRVKLGAAWLIEQAGFSKGYPRTEQRSSRVGISSKHALALVNRGGASAQDLLALMREIQEKVQARFGLRLETEPEFVGFDEMRPGSE